MLSGELRLVPALDAALAGDVLRAELFPSEPPRGQALSDRWSPWERDLSDRGVVPLSLLTAPHVLRDILRLHLDEFAAGGEVAEQSSRAMLGGQALFEGERLVLAVRCCSGLDSLASWDAASHMGPEPVFFDVGHPEVWPVWEAPWVVLREEDENAPCELGDVVVVREWRLLPQALERAVSTARREQEAFARRLEPFLAERFAAETVPEIAATLAGLR